MPLKLYNTRTKQKEIFQPLDPKPRCACMCAARPFMISRISATRARVIVFDVLFRLLKHLSAKGEWDGGKGETKVIYARNITDVDDKINARAAEGGHLNPRPDGEDSGAISCRWAALSCLPPTVEPRATEHIPEMISLIERLIARGHAYAAEGHVLFNVPSDPNYGALARRSLDEMRAGARVEVAPYKRDPMDFVLWKPSRASEPGWESPWGFGRPGWHLGVLGDVGETSRRGVRHSWRRHRPRISAPRKRGGAVDLRAWHQNHGQHLDAQRASSGGRRQDVESLGNFVTIHELCRTGLAR